MENDKAFQYNKKLRNRPNIINSPLYGNKFYLRNSITSGKMSHTRSLQNISMTFIAKQDSEKNNSQKILTDYSTNSDSKSIINNIYQISPNKKRKNDSISQNLQIFETNTTPYKKKITKFIKNFENNKSNLMIENQEKILYNNSPFNSSTISDYMYNSNYYYNDINLNEYDKIKKEYSLFDNYYLDNHYNDNNFYNKLYNKDKPLKCKTCSSNSNKKNKNYIKNISSSSKIIGEENNNQKKINKLLKQLKLYDKKLNELISQNKKINELNTILIRDNKQLVSNIKCFFDKYNNNLSIQKQINLIFENGNYSNKYNQNINKAKLFLILQEKFFKKKLDNKLLLFKYFNILYLYSKLNNNKKDQQHLIVIKNENLFFKKTKDIYKNINNKNKLLKSIINTANFKKSILVNYFENWKYKSKLLTTINFVKERKKKKKEKSKLKRRRKKYETYQNSWSNNNSKNTINNFNYFNKINSYDKKKEEDLWYEYDSEYSDEEKSLEEEEEKRQNFTKSKSDIKNYYIRKNNYFNYYKH